MYEINHARCNNEIKKITQYITCDVKSCFKKIRNWFLMVVWSLKYLF